MTKKKEPEIRVRTSKEFKLKPKENKNIQVVHLKDFGFIPETLIFERRRGSWFAISAVLTPQEIKRTEKISKEEKK